MSECAVLTRLLIWFVFSVQCCAVWTSIGQFTRLLRSLELRAVSHCTVLLLWDQKLIFRKRDCFEGSILHLPTIWLDAIEACMTSLQVLYPSKSAQLICNRHNCLSHYACLLSFMCASVELNTTTTVESVNARYNKVYQATSKCIHIRIRESIVLVRISQTFP